MMEFRVVNVRFRMILIACDHLDAHPLIPAAAATQIESNCIMAVDYIAADVRGNNTESTVEFNAQRVCRIS
jgi:hypothetical protein